MYKKNKFDQNRQINMEDNSQRIIELETVLKQQELKINQQQQQLLQQQEQIQQAQQQQQQQQSEQLQQHHYQQHIQHEQLTQQNFVYDNFGFNMTAKDIIEQFRRLKPLDEKHNPRAFIHAVETNLDLCGNNENLAQFCIRIVANEKILGDAGRRVRELQSNASWEEMKAKMLQGYRPKRTYAEIFNYCRTIKVRNLNELFGLFEKCKYEINDIYLADQFKPNIYKPENVDRDLVDIMLEKIDGPIRAHIGEQETLNDIILKYTKLKLLDDSRAIAFNHRCNTNYNRNQNHNYPKSKSNNNFPNHNSNQQYYEPSTSFQNQSNNSFRRHNFQQQSPNYKNYGQGVNTGRNLVQRSTPNRFSSQVNNNQNINYSGQQRQANYYSQKPEPMDIGNLKEEEDVNFYTMPPSQNYP